MKRSSRLWLTPLALAVGQCFGDTSIIVNNLSEGSVIGQCTLSDAVTALNTLAAVNACSAGDGGNDTIDLTVFTAPSKITFSSAPDHYSALLLAKPATIKGSLDIQGQPLVTIERSTVSGVPNFRLIATNSDLSINGIALNNGRTSYNGGAIYAGGPITLHISHAAVTGNSASEGGGVYVSYIAESTMIDHSVISGNTATMDGGGVEEHGTSGSVTLLDTQVIGNSAWSGGGIYADGAAILTNVTVSSNRAAGDGGGIDAGSLTATGSTFSGNSSTSHGGGLAVFGNAFLTNSTISGNSSTYAGGGLFAFTANLNFCTVSGNSYTMPGYMGGGLYVAQSATLTSSILTGNVGNDVMAPYEITVGGSYNIIGVSNDTLPADTRECDAKLGPLASFGGATKTIPLLVGSCAIDTGPTNPNVSTDQRGYPRPIGLSGTVAHADVGAFEKQSIDDPDFIFINGFGSAGTY